VSDAANPLIVAPNEDGFERARVAFDPFMIVWSEASVDESSCKTALASIVIVPVPLTACTRSSVPPATSMAPLSVIATDT
jgi:hypothetical protein